MKPEPDDLVEVFNREERAVLRVMERSQQICCIHEMHALSNVPYHELLKALSSLQRRGKIFREPSTALGKMDQQYRLRSVNPALVAEHFKEDRLSPLIGLTEVEMMNRVVMLKRMKRILINEWTPIVDILLGDYERDLERVRRAREPLEPDEEDDRDHYFDEG